MEPQDYNVEVSNEDIQFMESIFDLWKKKTPNKQINTNKKSDIDDDLQDTTCVSLDYFKGNDDIIQFISFISNINNISCVKDKKQIMIAFRKYRELLDILMIAFPYIKNKSREFGIAIPKLIEEQEEFRKDLKKLFKNSI